MHASYYGRTEIVSMLLAHPGVEILRANNVRLSDASDSMIDNWRAIFLRIQLSVLRSYQTPYHICVFRMERLRWMCPKIGRPDYSSMPTVLRDVLFYFVIGTAI